MTSNCESGKRNYMISRFTSHIFIDTDVRMKTDQVTRIVLRKRGL